MYPRNSVLGEPSWEKLQMLYFTTYWTKKENYHSSLCWTCNKFFDLHKLWIQRWRTKIHAYKDMSSDYKQNGIYYSRKRRFSTTAKERKTVKKQRPSSIILNHIQWHPWWAKGNEWKNQQARSKYGKKESHLSNSFKLGWWQWCIEPNIS